MISLYWLDILRKDDFPPLETALREPDGLLAAGGDLSPGRLIEAYQRGIFPWFNEGEPVLWWSPDPRFVLYPEELKVSRSLMKNIRNGGFHISMDRAFDQVISHCARVPRKDQPGTWISTDMRNAYMALHEQGHAHSVECWQGDDLVGGLYGVRSGVVFCGESMFSRVSNASKIALYYLCQFLNNHNFKLIDSQVYTPHLERLGARMIPREEYIRTLQSTNEAQPPEIQGAGKWQQLFADFLVTQSSSTKT